MFLKLRRVGTLREPFLPALNSELDSMGTIAVVGAGPVGLATADQLSRANATVLLICPRAAGSAESSSVMRQTWPAALAFWTPFSSGLSADEEEIQSRESLEFYQPFKDLHDEEAGVRWRTVEHYWQEGTCRVPAWTSHHQLDFRPHPHGPEFFDHANAPFRWRCEYRYTAPVIDVDRFLRWYLEVIASRPSVRVVRSWNYPLCREMESDDNARRAWQQLLNDENVASIVLCTGAGTVYQQLCDDQVIAPNTVAFKKGVVARISADVDPEEHALLYHGGTFDRDALCYVPHQRCIVLGGIVHDAARFDRPTDWQVLPAERDGILRRADMFLPRQQREKLAAAGLWDPTRSSDIQWRAGVRPMLEGCGPQVADASEMSQRLSALLDRKVEIITHFGHGGSGFTLSHHTARVAAARVLGG